LVDPATYRLWLQAGRGTAEHTLAYSAAGAVALDPLGFSNPLRTSGVVPAFSPNWYANLYVADYTSTFVRLAYNQDPTRGATIDWSLRLGTVVAITPGETSYTINHNLNNSSAVVLVAISWNGPVYVTSHGANSMVVDFATEPQHPRLLWWGTHADSTDATGSQEAVDAGSGSWTIRHNLGKIGPFFWLTSWPTTTKIHERNDDTVTLKFQVEAPSGATIDWRAKKPSAS
jgi:hypothetical protein